MKKIKASQKYKKYVGLDDNQPEYYAKKELALSIGELIINEIGTNDKTFKINDSTIETVKSVDFFILSNKNGHAILEYLKNLQKNKYDIAAQVISEDLIKLL